MPLLDSFTETYLRELHEKERLAVIEYLENIESTPILPKIRKTVTNLYSTLKDFISVNCLIVVNNFEGVDMYPTIFMNKSFVGLE